MTSVFRFVIDRELPQKYVTMRTAQAAGCEPQQLDIGGEGAVVFQVDGCEACIVAWEVVAAAPTATTGQEEIALALGVMAAAILVMSVPVGGEDGRLAAVSRLECLLESLTFEGVVLNDRHSLGLGCLGALDEECLAGSFDLIQVCGYVAGATAQLKHSFMASGVAA
eukprot:CAMPEP_0115859186 /NCGR_PEP_ID=MMETSP0287-20121206/16485_1 /TAXON_ID=412157 /ORGANISM="Chrysochromulina rotalis, Strain UIO044" /LENGTH=166 /DNA_ID=CAMNT_0003313477 /DNA_START=120 /DNA_END=618 /DNA_ORIENTATION=+